jgi:citrate synthase
LLDLKLEHGNTVVSEVNVNQIIGGARGVKCLFYDTSKLDAKRVSLWYFVL